MVRSELTNSSDEAFHLGFSFLQMIIVLHPSRIRHNRDKGADVQQGPAQRFLFRLRPCINLFYYLLLLHTLWTLNMTERDIGVLDTSSCQTNACIWKHRAHHRGRYSAQYMS